MSDINYPTPMGEDAKKALRGVYLDDRLFSYGNNWYGTAEYYKYTYPGFTDQQCHAMEAYSNGIRAKEYRNILKKVNKRCFESKNEAK